VTVPEGTEAAPIWTTEPPPGLQTPAEQ